VFRPDAAQSIFFAPARPAARRRWQRGPVIGFAAPLAAAASLGLALAAAAARPALAQSGASDPASEPPAASGARDVIRYSGAADVRYRDTNRETRGSYIAATRFQVDWARTDPRNGDRPKAGGRAQLYLEADNRRGTAVNRLRASEVYGYYDFTLSGVSARLRAGQFAVPFGLTPVYDPLQPLQPLYDKALGLRVDTGISLEGEYGPYRYVGAITTGVGPNRLNPGRSRTLSFRLSRNVETKLGVFEVGGSLLSGRGPVTASTPRSRVGRAGHAPPRRPVAHRRGRPVLLRPGHGARRGHLRRRQRRPRVGLLRRGELRAARPARGHAGRFPQAVELPGQAHVVVHTGAGLNYDLGGGLVLRALYEFQRDVPLPAGTSPEITRRVTLQTRLNF
jgi:hypothetical protein